MAAALLIVHHHVQNARFNTLERSRTLKMFAEPSLSVPEKAAPHAGAYKNPHPEDCKCENGVGCSAPPQWSCCGLPDENGPCARSLVELLGTYKEMPEERRAWAAVKALITTKAAREKGRYRMLPLHYAAAKQAPLEVVAALLEAHKAGAAEKNSNGSLPLHYAAEKQAPLEVVAALLVAHKAGAAEKNSNGSLPLHWAAANKAPLEVVLALLEAHKAGAAEKDDKGMLPLHHSIATKAPLAVVALLLLAFPDGANAKDDKRNLPVHLAKADSNWELIDCLLFLFLPDSVPSPLSPDLWFFRAGVVPVGRSGVSSFGNRIAFLLQFVKDLYKSSSVATFEWVLVNITHMCALQERSLSVSGLAQEERCVILAGMNSLRFLAHNLSYRRKDVVASMHLHLCGDGCSGKTTLRSVLEGTLMHWGAWGFKQSSTLGFTPRKVKAIDLEEGRTQGMEMSHVQHKDRPFKFILYDYGGQEEFRVNHSRFLDRPDSVFLVVVPLWDMLAGAKDASGEPRGAAMDPERMLARYRYWLSFVNSSCSAPVKRCLTIINFREKICTALGPKAKDRLENAEKAIMEEQGRWKGEGFLFPTDVDVATGTCSPTRVQPLDANKSEDVWNYIKPQDSLGARDDCVVSSPVPYCISTVLDTRQRLQDGGTRDQEGLLSRARSLLGMDKKNGAKDKWPLIETEDAFKSRIRKALVEAWAAGIASDGSDESTVRFLTDLTFARLLELQEVATLERGGHVVTDLQWLTSTALGALVKYYEKKERSEAEVQDFLLSDEVINDVAGNCGELPSNVVPQLLEEIGACIPVDEPHGTGRSFPAFMGSGKLLVERRAGAGQSGAGEAGDETFFDKVDKFVGEASTTRKCLRRFRLERPEQQMFPRGYQNRLFVEAFRMHTGCQIVLQNGVGYENAIDLQKDKGNEDAHGSIINGKLRLIIMHSTAGGEASILVAVLSKGGSQDLVQAAIEAMAAVSVKIRAGMGPVRVIEYCVDNLSERSSSDVIREMEEATAARDYDAVARLSAFLFGRDGSGIALQSKTGVNVSDLFAFVASKYAATTAKLDELQRTADKQLRSLESVDAKLEACLESTLGRLDGLAASIARRDLFLSVKLSALVRDAEGSAALQRQHGTTLADIAALLEQQTAEGHEGQAAVEAKLDEALQAIGDLSRDAVETKELLRVLEYNDNAMPYSFIIVDKTTRRRLSQVDGYEFLESKVDAAPGVTGMMQQGATRFKAAFTERLRVLFVCPVTGRIVPCGPEGNGYHLVLCKNELKVVQAFVAVVDVLIAAAVKSLSSGLVSAPPLSALVQVPDVPKRSREAIERHLDALPQGQGAEDESWLAAVLRAVNDEHLKLGAVYDAVVAAEGYVGGEWEGPRLTGLEKRQPPGGGRTRWASKEGWRILDDAAAAR